jgi:hypothetical protein
VSVPFEGSASEVVESVSVGDPLSVSKKVLVVWVLVMVVGIIFVEIEDDELDDVVLEEELEYEEEVEDGWVVVPGVLEDDVVVLDVGGWGCEVVV